MMRRLIVFCLVHPGTALRPRLFWIYYPVFRHFLRKGIRHFPLRKRSFYSFILLIVYYILLFVVIRIINTFHEHFTMITALLRQALTDRINDREMFMKGIDYSYYYEEEDIVDNE